MFVQGEQRYKLAAIGPSYIVFREFSHQDRIEAGEGEVVLTVDGEMQRWRVLLTEPVFRFDVGEAIEIQALENMQS